MDIGLSHIPVLEVEIRLHGLRWLTYKLGEYSLLIVQEFNAAYAATILQELLKGKKTLNQPKLREVLVRGRRIDISEKMIHRMSFGPTYRAPETTVEFDQRFY